MDLRDQVRQLKRKRNLWSLRSNRQKTNSASWHVFEGMVKRYADICILNEYRDSLFLNIFDWGKSIQFGCKKESGAALLQYVFDFLVSRLFSIEHLQDKASRV